MSYPDPGGRGILPGQYRPGGLLGGVQPQPESGRKPSVLDRILGLYGADPGTHIPQDQRGNALSRGLTAGGMAAARISGRGHDRPTVGQHLANFAGAMGTAGPQMAAEGRRAKLQEVMRSGDPQQLQAIMMELMAAGDPESMEAAKLIQQHIASQTRVLGEGAKLIGPGGIEIANNAKPGSRFDGLKQMDLGDNIAFLDDQGRIVHQYRKQDANELRDDFRDEAKEYALISERLGTVESSAVKADAPGDLALIFAYMKILDPTSVVRESEFQNAAHTAGIPDRLIAFRDYLVTGKRLAPEVRAAFVRRARIMGRDRQRMMEPMIERYRRRAEGMGVNPDDVIHDPFETFDFSSVAKIPYRGASIAGADDIPSPPGDNPDVPDLD